MKKFGHSKSLFYTRTKGFTLSEVMIVLVVIGVITGILLPTAIQLTPDENVMKFKKGYNTLGQVIRELVTSDKYYKDGDLGTRANGELIDATHEGDYTYFCETFADVVNTKNKKCMDYCGWHGARLLKENNGLWEFHEPVKLTPEILHNTKKSLDEACHDFENANLQEEIITLDKIIYYQTSACSSFGVPNPVILPDGSYKRAFSNPNEKPTHYDLDGMDIAYKIFCMDIDGLNKGEAAFGFGIRADGKILPGVRADDWINKSIQKEE